MFTLVRSAWLGVLFSTFVVVMPSSATSKFVICDEILNNRVSASKLLETTLESARTQISNRLGKSAALSTAYSQIDGAPFPNRMEVKLSTGTSGETVASLNYNLDRTGLDSETAGVDELTVDPRLEGIDLETLLLAQLIKSHPAITEIGSSYTGIENLKAAFIITLQNPESPATPQKIELYRRNKSFRDSLNQQLLGTINDLPAQPAATIKEFRDRAIDSYQGTSLAQAESKIGFAQIESLGIIFDEETPIIEVSIVRGSKCIRNKVKIFISKEGRFELTPAGRIK